MKEPIARIRVTLQDLTPAIWRTADVPRSISLMSLHKVIQVMFGWSGAHVFEFRVGDRDYLGPDPGNLSDFGVEIDDMNNTRLQALVDGGVSMFTYVYDFGDYWLHSIRVMDLGTGKADVDYPSFVQGARRCPPEDVGGTTGFERFLEAIRDPHHKRHERMVEWHEAIYGKRFDPYGIETTRIRFGLAAIARGRQGAAISHRVDQ